MTIKKLSDDRERVEKLYTFENELYAQGYNLIAGVDEAGRGSLVGSMTVAAVILPKNLYLPKLNDSKKISAHIREILYEEIILKAISFSVIEVSVEEIDEFNIYQATLRGMKRAVESLDTVPNFVLTDAMKLDFGDKIRTQSIIHGDALSASIAAASIIAKVTRDRMTDEWHKKYTDYGFDHNRGYGTKTHIEAIKKIGSCPLHRKSFNPVKSILAGLQIERK
ncbi:MAG: ribonuclease HII [Selenomonadaceae bacterium]|nr:ribonuclease HII [Selenomonadaceae bacterium]